MNCVQPAKIFPLLVSKTYLSGHPKAGYSTDFKRKILDGRKIHTLRTNYLYWKRIEASVKSGIGYLSLRQWSDKAYRSPQVEFMKLHHIHVDHVVIETKGYGKGSAAVTVTINGKDCTSRLDEIAKNDGLENGLDLIQWLGWDGFDGALIHFTDFKY